jgi:hypothetical protein
LVVDVLQKAIQHAANEGFLRHPVLEEQPCPVLQYADDTLIVLQGDIEQAKCLKQILDDFACTTGLKINLSKSTFGPINLTEQDDVLNCKVASFPQNYLGLPLSDSKLPREVFLPYISAVEKRISFSLDIITSGGRLTLTKSVLSALPAYLMSCIKLPQWVINEIERLLRAFFWKGKSTIHGSDCLVAWDFVCRDYREGGLGIKNLRIQNECLLKKFVHRLLVEPNSPWARWARLTHLNGKDLGDQTTNQTRAWVQINSMIEIYRNSTCVQIGDGKCTSMWKDKWTTNGPLCFQFPALFSHAIRPNISISDCWIDGNWTNTVKSYHFQPSCRRKRSTTHFLAYMYSPRYSF